jgi:ABC-type transporter Mla subunit MlaD
MTGRALLGPSLVAAAVIATLVLVLSSGSTTHRVYLTVRDAADVIPSQQVRAAGVVVGSVDSIKPIDGGRAVRVGLNIDDKVWPLRSEAKLTLHWGGTISAYNRYFELQPSDTGAAIPNGGALARSQVTVPVEFDQLLGTFVPALRGDVRTFINTAGANLLSLKAPLRDAVARSPHAVHEVARVVSDLDADEHTLDVLIRSASDVVGAAQDAQPGVGQLVDSAGTTLGAIADQADATRETLTALPVAMRRVRSTASRADVTLEKASATTARLKPGVAELQAIAPRVSQLLQRVVSVGPDLSRTLATARVGAPAITTLLDRVTKLTPATQTAVDQGNKVLDCVRPYTPDIIGFVSNWGGIWGQKEGDGTTAAQFWVSLDPAALPNNSPLTTAQAAKIFPGLQLAMPEPPGYQANQPWFQPQCNVTSDAFDPMKDLESVK